MTVRTMLIASLMPVVWACGSQEVSSLDSPEQRSGYAIGMDIGTNLREVADMVDSDALIQGLLDALAEDSTLLGQAEARQVLNEFGARAQAAVAAQRNEAAEQNRLEGEAFLAENGQRDGVTTTESGLQYEVLTEGTGPRPTASDRVRVHYAGTFPDGTPFESTYESGTPAEFAVGGVIPGWSEALQLMPVGSKYKLYVPGDLAYGPNGSRSMGPNQTLVFEVELLEIL